ncbi:RecX family transcriptional regulator [Plantibacter sp. YIM 135347]|uniref:regulatory protein RecX n=1 Tax=Plantibacter sp. YIM 135347 TaxID=3423919 RepID=UPI003D34E3FF
MAVEFRPGDDEVPSGATVSYFPGVGPDGPRNARRAGAAAESAGAASAPSPEPSTGGPARSATGTRSAARAPLRAVVPVPAAALEPVTPTPRTAGSATDDEGWAAEPRDEDREFVQKMRNAIAEIDGRSAPVVPRAPGADTPSEGIQRSRTSPPAESTETTGAVRALPAKRVVAFVETPTADDDDEEDGSEASAPEPVDPAVRLAELDLLVVRKLARRAYSEWEVAEVLRGNDAEPHEVEHLLEEFRRRGYLDDAALAEQLVETLHARKGQSRSVIARELSSKRIDQSIIQVALEAIDDDDELERALVVARKRAGQLSSYDAATAERRLTAYLSRRGYGSSIVREACKQALSGTKRSGVSFR